MKKILVIQTASIGDVILMTSLLETLHKTYPKSQLDILIKKENSSLFVHHPFIRNLFLFDKKENKYKNLLQLIFQIRKEKYDLTINIQRFFSSGLISIFSGAKEIRGFKKNPLSFFFSKRFRHIITEIGNVHEIERNHILIEDLTELEISKPKLYPSQQDYALTSGYKTQKYICIAPGSLWQTKQFPLDQWVKLISQVNDDTLIHIIGGKNDKTLSSKIIEESQNKNCINLCGKLTLLQTTALMEHAQMNITNDSAPLHLATSINAPITAIFCSTIPEFGFGPLSDHSQIIQTETHLNCRPCGIHGYEKCPEGHFKCGHEIDTQKILNTIFY